MIRRQRLYWPKHRACKYKQVFLDVLHIQHGLARPCLFASFGSYIFCYYRAMGDVFKQGNLLPEFGSLPWALKPLLVLVIERGCSAKSQQRLLAAATIITAATWLLLSLGSFIIFLPALASSELIYGLFFLSLVKIHMANKLKPGSLCMKIQTVVCLKGLWGRTEEWLNIEFSLGFLAIFHHFSCWGPGIARAARHFCWPRRWFRWVLQLWMVWLMAWSQLNQPKQQPQSCSPCAKPGTA